MVRTYANVEECFATKDVDYVLGELAEMPFEPL
jgi:hypothetical protein